MFYRFQDFYAQWAVPLGNPLILGLGGIFILVIAVWSIYWKYRALWRAARQTGKIWFVVLLVVNTLGILEILYIYYWSDKKEVVPSNI